MLYDKMAMSFLFDLNEDVEAMRFLFDLNEDVELMPCDVGAEASVLL